MNRTITWTLIGWIAATTSCMQPASETQQVLIQDVYGKGLCEIEHSRLAMSKAVDSKVKELAGQMMQARADVNTQLHALAAEKQVRLPESVTAEQVEEIEAALHKNGNDYDASYIDALISGHEQTISLCEKAASECSDRKTKKVLNNALPMLKQDLQMAMSVKAHLEQP